MCEFLLKAVWIPEKVARRRPGAVSVPNNGARPSLAWLTPRPACGTGRSVRGLASRCDSPHHKVLSAQPVSSGDPMRFTHLGRATVAAVTITFATTAFAQQQQQQQRTIPSNRIALEQYLDWEDVGNPQLSPD